MNRFDADVTYDISVSIGALGLLLLTSGGRSLHERIVGRGKTEWGATNAALDPWFEVSPGGAAGLLGGFGTWGQPIDIPARGNVIDWE